MITQIRTNLPIYRFRLAPIEGFRLNRFVSFCFVIVFRIFTRDICIFLWIGTNFPLYSDANDLNTGRKSPKPGSRLPTESPITATTPTVFNAIDETQTVANRHPRVRKADLGISRRYLPLIDSINIDINNHLSLPFIIHYDVWDFFFTCECEVCQNYSLLIPPLSYNILNGIPTGNRNTNL